MFDPEHCQDRLIRNRLTHSPESIVSVTYLAVDTATGAVHYADESRDVIGDLIDGAEDRYNETTGMVESGAGRYRVDSVPTPVGRPVHSLITRPHCPECQEEARKIRADDPAARWGGRMAHLDGEPLCPVMTSSGYRPADHPEAER